MNYSENNEKLGKRRKNNKKVVKIDKIAEKYSQYRNLINRPPSKEMVCKGTVMCPCPLIHSTCKHKEELIPEL
jgi:hypothetical protein